MPRVRRIPPKKLQPSKCPLEFGSGLGLAVGASVEVEADVEVEVEGVVVGGLVVVIGVVESVVVELDDVVVVVVVVVSLDGVGSGVGMIVVTSGSPPLSHSEVFLATVTGAPSLEGSSSSAAMQVSEVS